MAKLSPIEIQALLEDGKPRFVDCNWPTFAQVDGKWTYQGRGRGNNNNADPMAKAKRTGGIIAPTENKVTTYDDSDDDE